MDNVAGRQSSSENLKKIELTGDSGGCVPLQLDRCVECSLCIAKIDLKAAILNNSSCDKALISVQSYVPLVLILMIQKSWRVHAWVTPEVLCFGLTIITGEFVYSSRLFITTTKHIRQEHIDRSRRLWTCR